MTTVAEGRDEMGDMISRQAAITAIQKAYADTVGGTDRYAVWKNVGLTNALHIMQDLLQDLPSVQTEKMQLSKEDATKGTTFDCISRQAVIDTLDVGAECLRRVLDETDIVGTEREKYKWGLRLFEACISDMKELPSAQPQPCQNHTQKAPESDTFGVKTGETCSDTISRKAAIDALEIEKTYSAVYKYGYTQTDYFKQYNTGLTDGIKALNKLPSAQPEIIRCKDCKYWMRAYLSISGKHGCNVMRDYTAPDDYCFKAERKA